jgi:hypothetical protein
MSCNLSQSSFIDEHLLTFSLTELGNPSQMKSLLFCYFSSIPSWLQSFALFELSYPVKTDSQI